ncbi:MAG: type II secretion system protein [Burkholderiales bacterium]|nr:type II secretion system protein [Burkholderiales bacterium]OJX06753.1 MAG: hypothetical protein BGO72_00185 [Burkholderiales bacterium 70-64]
MANGSASRRRQRGLGYLVLLFWLALGACVLAGEGVLWSMQRQRDREEELLFVGDQMRRAIASYYETSPGPVKRYPDSLQALLDDRRQLSARRHLRRVYADPMTGRPQWGLVIAPDGGVMGVYSTSGATPLKRAGFAERDAEFTGKARYSEWVFLYRGELVRQVPPTMLRYVDPS